MAWYDSFYTKKKKKKRSGAYKRQYAGASTGRLFADWLSPYTTADKEIKDSLRTLRNRSRALARNESIIARYLNLLSSNVVGNHGIRLASKGRNDNGDLDIIGNGIIEDAFLEWADLGVCTANGRQSWIDCQNLFIKSLARDGEVLIRHLKTDENRFGYQIQFLEADHLDDEYNSNNPSNGNRIVMGVELNSFNKPLAYYLFQNHPADTPYTYSNDRKYMRIPASELIHAYMPTRAEQTRGVPFLSPILLNMKMLSGFRESALVNARVGASKMGFFIAGDGDEYIGESTEDTYTQVMDAQAGTFEQLPAGTDFREFKPDYPNQTFADFEEAMLRSIASGLNVSYVSLANNLEGVNYSSIRQGVMDDRDQFRVLQNFMIQHMMRPIYKKWLECAMTRNAINLPITRYEKFSFPTFLPRSWSWIDPLKEINAHVKGLESGQYTFADIQSSLGRDPEELFEALDRERKLAEQYNIDYGFSPYGANKTPVPPDLEINEEDEE